MWTAKISFYGAKALLGEKSIEHKINLVGFPLSYYYENNWVFVHIAGVIFGEEKKKKLFIKDLKKSNRVVNIEVNGDFIIGTIKEQSITKTFYNKDIIHLAPTIISNGNETMTIGSFKKDNLVKAIKVFEKLHNAKIYYIQQKKIKNISIVKEHPDLTKKQKEAMALALKHGYYDYPRKISLEKLSKLNRLSFSTFHAHLRKAEHKLMPFFFESSL